MTTAVPDQHQRVTTAAALRDLLNAYVAHDADPALLGDIADFALANAARLREGNRRDRLALMRAARTSDPDGPLLPAPSSDNGFEDRAAVSYTHLTLPTNREV